MNGINVSNFKVIYKDKVIRAISIIMIDVQYSMQGEVPDTKPLTTVPIETLDILVLNDLNQVEIIRDKSSSFQFIPVV